MSISRELVENLRNDSALIAHDSILMVVILFPSTMSREAIINSTIGLLTEVIDDYESHITETLPDDSVRLMVNLDS